MLCRQRQVAAYVSPIFQPCAWMPCCAGSGKSSLLGAALGLMQQVAGEAVEVHGGIAYVPQARFLPLDTATKQLSHSESQVLDPSGDAD